MISLLPTTTSAVLLAGVLSVAFVRTRYPPDLTNVGSSVTFVHVVPPSAEYSMEDVVPFIFPSVEVAVVALTAERFEGVAGRDVSVTSTQVPAAVSFVSAVRMKIFGVSLSRTVVKLAGEFTLLVPSIEIS